MPALLDSWWLSVAGLGLASLLCGYAVRHLCGLQAERAHARRVWTLCEQMDVKDGKLHGLRAELQTAQERVWELQRALAARHAAAASADRFELINGSGP